MVRNGYDISGTARAQDKRSAPTEGKGSGTKAEKNTRRKASQTNESNRKSEKKESEVSVAVKMELSTKSEGR